MVVREMIAATLVALVAAARVVFCGSAKAVGAVLRWWDAARRG